MFLQIVSHPEGWAPYSYASGLYGNGISIVRRVIDDQGRQHAMEISRSHGGYIGRISPDGGCNHTTDVTRPCSRHRVTASSTCSTNSHSADVHSPHVKPSAYKSVRRSAVGLITKTEQDSSAHSHVSANCLTPRGMCNEFVRLRHT